MRDFYRLNEPSPDPTAVERFFSTLENDAGPILQSIDRAHRPPSKDELDFLLMFMAFQFVRVPSFRPIVDGVRQRLIHEGMMQRLETRDTWIAELQASGWDPNEPEFEFERVKRSFENGEWNVTADTNWYLERAFEGVERIQDLLRERHWGAIISDRGRFIASDNPILLDGEADEMVGFRNANVVGYAVSRHVFLLGTRERVPQQPENFKNIARMNTFTLLRAGEQVYSHVQNFDFLDHAHQSQHVWTLFEKARFRPSNQYV